MFKYKLKAGQESFTPVEGPFALKTFKPGQTYAEIPPEEAGRFTEVDAPARSGYAARAAAAVENPAKTDKKKAAVGGPATPPSEDRR